MENLIQNEILKNAENLLKKSDDLSMSYQTARKNALAQFALKGIPSKKDEAFKYTPLAKKLSLRFVDNTENECILPDNVRDLILDLKGLIVFHNGLFNKFLSVIPTGLEFLALPLEEEFFDSYDALNFGVAQTPISLVITKNTVIDYPITILHLTDELGANKMLSSRINVVALENSKASFIELFSTPLHLKDKNQYTNNSSLRFSLRENAFIEHVKIQMEADKAVHIGLTKAEVNKDAHFKSITLDFGIQTSRHNISINLNGTGAETSAHGFYILKENEHGDIFSTITQCAPHTSSEQLFKGILAGNSHGVFTGIIDVLKDAQKSSSSQLNKNLIIGKSAHIDTRPQLLVHADDVKCSHGATVGQLSKDEEFYLESRGIPETKVKKMLSFGFAAEIILKIEHPALKLLATKILNDYFLNNSLNE